MSNDSDRVAAALADRYTIQRELGRGGMATVYLADDLRHNRPVAIKVLKPELATALGPDRFLREIEVTAQLHHPMILPLLDSGEADGTLFYVMPYVEGESLRDRLDRERQLSLEDALQITKDVAEALGYAHSRGVIHRDIKPENILLESGHALVADFGIAKAVTEAGGERLTGTGVSIGTPAYMSPEQAEATAPVDARSDLYSLGCVLYEMLAGHPPFTGTTAHELIVRHASDPIPPLRSGRSTVPEPIEDAVDKVLAKVPADRYATAQQFSQALQIDVAVYRRTQRRKRWLRRVGSVAAGLAVLFAGTYGTVRYRAATDWKRQPLDANAVVIMPFEVTGSSGDVRALEEGMQHLLFAVLTGDVGPRAVDVASLLRRRNDWQARNRWDTEDVPLRLAASFNAGLLLEGAIVETGPEFLVNAVLRQVPAGNEVARTSVPMSRDSLQLLPHRLLARLLGDRLGESTDRLAAFDGRPAEAVLAYLSGVRAQRVLDLGSAVRRFREALAADSTFALAALRLAETPQYPGEGPQAAYERYDDALARARRHRAGLGARDAAALVYYELKNRVDTTGTAADAAEAARAWAELAVDEPAAWLEYALQLGGTWVDPNREERRQRGLRLAWELDSVTPSLVREQFNFALQDGDRERVKRMGAQLLAVIDTTLPWYPGLVWGLALLEGDSGTVQELRARLEQDDPRVATWEVLGRVCAVPYGLGLSLADCELMQRRLQGRLLTRADSVTWAEGFALQGGPYDGRFRQTIEGAVGSWGLYQGMEAFTWPWIIGLSLLYPQLDSTAGVAADSLREFLSHRLSEVRRTSTTEVENARCHLELYRVTHGDTVGARDAVGQLRPRLRAANMTGVCPALVEAILESYGGVRSQAPALERLDSLLKVGPMWEIPLHAAMIVVPRLRRQRGELTLALAAASRRWPRFVLGGQAEAALLREEGDLATMVGDTARAIEAYSRLLEIWHAADDLGRQWTDSVRTALDALVRARG